MNPPSLFCLSVYNFSSEKLQYCIILICSFLYEPLYVCDMFNKEKQTNKKNLWVKLAFKC